MAEAVPLPGRIATEIRRYELTLSDYWRIIFKRRLTVVFSFVMVLTAAIVYTNAKTPLYEASATVRISSAPRAFQYEGGYVASMSDTLNNYINLITSDEVVQRVVLRLKLLPPDAKMEQLNEKVNEIRGSISASASENNTIGISVTYATPELAAAIANQTAAAFVEVDLLEKTKKARNLRGFIETQLSAFTEKLKNTEEQMREFRQSGRALGVASGMEQNLVELEKERSILTQQFTEKHPDVIKVNLEIESLRERIKKLPADELELARLQRELEINDRAYRMMKDKHQSARIAEAEEVSDAILLESAAIPSTPISPQKNLNKMAGAMVGLVLGVLLAFIQENLDTSIGAIEDVEQIIRLPVIGVIPYFNPHEQKYSWWRIDQSVLNFFTRRQDVIADSSYLIMNQDTLSTLSEAYRILRTFIEFLMGEKGSQGKTLMITSTGPQEGKTLTACNIAVSLVQAGRKVLLIDADLRRPMVHRLFGIKRSPGLSDVLLGTIPFLEARRTMGDILVGENVNWDHMLTSKMLDRLDILTTGIHTHTPAELIASDAMKDMVNQMRLRYDYIIIDSPPVLPVTDSRTLGTLADATFFIYRAGKTARRALTRAKEELLMAGVKVKGIILNQATPEVTLTDSYYYQYYGESKGAKQQQAQDNET